MTVEWVKVDTREFMSRKGVKRRGEHQMTRRVLHWRACARCGLMNLKNDATRRALRAQCEWEEDK